MFTGLCVFSIASFYGYGTSCILSPHMVGEFDRYGLAKFRVLTGFLQLLGATGLLVGIWLSPLIGLISAFGLAMQMLLGFSVRVRIKDSILQSLPSFLYLCANLWLAFGFYIRLS